MFEEKYYLKFILMFFQSSKPLFNLPIIFLSVCHLQEALFTEVDYQENLVSRAVTTDVVLVAQENHFSRCG